MNLALNFYHEKLWYLQIFVYPGTYTEPQQKLDPCFGKILLFRRLRNSITMLHVKMQISYRVHFCFVSAKKKKNAFA
jgi:hypothetical protein